MSTAKARETRLESLRLGDTIHEIREIGDVGDGLARLGAGLHEMVDDLPDCYIQLLPRDVEWEKGVGL